MAAGVTKPLWEMGDVVDVLEAWKLSRDRRVAAYLGVIRSLAVQHFPVFARDLEQLVADVAISTLSGESRKPVCLSAKKVNAIHDALPRVFQAEARFAQVPRLGPNLNRRPKARLYKIEHPVCHNWLTHDPRAASVAAPSAAWYGGAHILARADRAFAERR